MSSQTATRARRSAVGDAHRRVVCDPLTPIALLAATLAASAALGAPTVAWLALAAIAGHSLSGST